MKSTKQIRASYTDDTIRVYQAFNHAIADSALRNGTFISPPFKMDRMTWIKPSFLWMMYRSGWGKKDDGQNRILAIDISREGFEWALEHSCLSHFNKENYRSKEEWQLLKEHSPVRIQWDPERDIFSAPQSTRSIQIGLSQGAVKLYVNEWIQNITDITDLAREIKGLIDSNQIESALQRLPVESPFPISESIRNICGAYT